ncbi:MAG: MoxR family ATPase [Deltaproteobacteria bacterium]|nr:MoxR family ATPase [Deltaproteobacteria bacterium]
MDSITQIAERIREQSGRVVMGLEDVTELLLVALLCEGHVILEGVPGTGKTLLARTFARSLALQYKRVQFTPDLMPADILGTNIFNFQKNEFILQKGPIFTEFLLADEINRTPPKTQAALLESMQERSVTIDGTSYRLSPLFLVVATQNPIEQEGTYPLPEAQLDRFLFKLQVGFPSEEQERAMVALHGHQTAMPDLDRLAVQPLIGREEILALRQAVSSLHLSDEMVAYIVSLVRTTRTNPNLLHGASPRSANMIATATRALAAIRGRAYAIPDDVKEIFLSALRHRVVMTPAAHIEGTNTDVILRQVLQSVPAPR